MNTLDYFAVEVVRPRHDYEMMTLKPGVECLELKWVLNDTRFRAIFDERVQSGAVVMPYSGRRFVWLEQWVYTRS